MYKNSIDWRQEGPVAQGMPTNKSRAQVPCGFHGSATDGILDPLSQKSKNTFLYLQNYLCQVSVHIAYGKRMDCLLQSKRPDRLHIVSQIKRPIFDVTIHPGLSCYLSLEPSRNRRKEFKDTHILQRLQTQSYSSRAQSPKQGAVVVWITLSKSRGSGRYGQTWYKYGLSTQRKQEGVQSHQSRDP